MRFLIADCVGMRTLPTFDIHVGTLEGHPVVTSIHGEVGNFASGTEHMGDGKTVDYTFTNIKSSSESPEWYFKARRYAGISGICQLKWDAAA